MTIEELYDLIKEVTQQDKVSSMVESQIKRFIAEGYTYKEIGRCVYYFFVIKNNDVSKIEQYGIGIIRNVRNEANNYYDLIANKRKQQKEAAMQILNKKTEEVNFKPVRRSFHKKGVDISEL